MEKVICAIVRKYGKMMDYWMTETKWGFKRAGVALMIPFIIGVIIIEFNKEIAPVQANTKYYPERKMALRVGI